LVFVGDYKDGVAMTVTERIIAKATSGRFIAATMGVVTCCVITFLYPDQFGVRMFDFTAGILVGYFGKAQDRNQGRNDQV